VLPAERLEVLLRVATGVDGSARIAGGSDGDVAWVAEDLGARGSEGGGSQGQPQDDAVRVHEADIHTSTIIEPL
jgi:hypothetical protein